MLTRRASVGKNRLGAQAGRLLVSGTCYALWCEIMQAGMPALP
jgi:hypothetical protein